MNVLLTAMERERIKTRRRLRGGDPIADDATDPVEIWRTFSNVSKTWFKLAERNLRPLGLSLLEVRALKLLSESGPQPMVRLSDDLFVSQPAVTGVVDRLQEQGLAERVRDNDDRRIVRARITSGGERVLDRAIALHRAFVRESLGTLTGQEAERLSEILVRLGDALAAYDTLVELPAAAERHAERTRR